MENRTFDMLTQGMELAAPAPDALIASVEQDLGTKLPREYVEFLRRCNGAEGPIGECAYLVLWPVQNLKKLNVEYQVHEYAPGFLLFGSDGGGEAFAFDYTSKHARVVQIPFIGMDPNAAEGVSDSFDAFLRQMYERSADA
jgi:SMI1/KNR4 family protein SUKH-1